MLGSAGGRRAQEQHDQKVREETARMMAGAPVRPTLTEKAQTALVVVAGVVVLGAASAILHFLAVVLGVVLAVLCARRCVAVRRRRRMAARAAVPVPAAEPPRTVVTGVTVRAVEPGRRRMQAMAARRGVRSRP